MARILVIDDDESIRSVVGRILEMAGHAYALAANGREARACLADQDFDLVLCDIKMPGESGLNLSQDILSAYPGTAIIMMSAFDDPEIVKTAREVGTYGYILKPFKPNDLIIKVGNALHRREIEIANKARHDKLEDTVRKSAAELQETLDKLRKVTLGMIHAMTLTVEAKDPYTAGHQRRAANLARYIGTDMGLFADQIDGIRLAGVLHDLGKISVPVEILSKPSGLQELEYKIIQTHPQVAFDILKEVEFPWPIAQIVHQHHERINGSGYPLKISGEDILIEARVIAVADTVEAMSSHRPYRPALGIDEALREIAQNRGILYDPDVADTCIRLFDNKEFRF